MKNLPVRAPRAAVVLALLGMASLYHMPAIAADSVGEALLLPHGEFELGNGDTKVLVDRKVPEPYRVCVSKGADAVPVKIRYDGAEQLIAAGNCTEVTGKLVRSLRGRTAEGRRGAHRQV